MTDLLKRAFAELERLPDDEQDAIASRILANLSDEHQWSIRFEATTAAQWSQRADQARRDANAGETVDLDTALANLPPAR